jgi:hypothetical protein
MPVGGDRTSTAIAFTSAATRDDARLRSGQSSTRQTRVTSAIAATIIDARGARRHHADAIGIATTVAARRCSGEIARMDRAGDGFRNRKKIVRRCPDLLTVDRHHAKKPAK